MAQIERALLVEALRRAKGQASEAAEDVKLPRKTFYDKLTKYGLKASDYRG
jgi:two-component system C4-dicarboxylate transport response regulator DctD